MPGSPLALPEQADLVSALPAAPARRPRPRLELALAAPEEAEGEEGGGRRQPRPSFRVSTGGSSLKLLSVNASHEFELDSTGLRQHTRLGVPRGGAEARRRSPRPSGPPGSAV